MDEATDRCWAFSASGERCELIAGHDDKHAITKAWTDEECWKPGQSSVVIPQPVDEPEEDLGPVPAYGPDADNGRCMICNHAMHVMECERCDCKAGI